MWTALTKHISPAWLAFWAALPLAIGLIIVGLTLRAKATLYTPEAFTAEAIAQHSDYDTFMTEFKQAVFAGDHAKVMALQARNDPIDLQLSTAVSYKHPIEAIVNGQRYPYEDTDAWHSRAAEADFVIHRFGVGNMGIFYDAIVEQVNGRWVVAPEDAHFIVNSGRWQQVAGGIAVVYYALFAAGTGLVWFVRETASRTQERYRSYAEGST